MNDTEIFDLIAKEKIRQQETLALIPSENYASKEVLEAVGSVLTNKYSEGYAGKRYYQGNEFVDQIENTAIARAKNLFKVPYANVQAYSGSPANGAIYFALLNPGDLIMGLELSSGGHLTHGHPNVTFSGKFFKSVQYSVEKNGLIDYEKVRELAIKHQPKMIVSGTTAYPRALDFKKFGEIADEIGCWHLSDISHIAGLVCADQHESPVNYAHIVMFTTHKTLRGPRGAVILCTEKGLKKDLTIGSKIDKAIIPGMQGGPHNNTTAGIAVCLKEAEQNEFKYYAKQVVLNSKCLADELKKYDFNLVTDGTDNHFILIDLSNKKIDGWCTAWALEYVNIILNRNTVPYEKRSPFYPSGIRLGTPAITSRGMKETEMKQIAHWINETVNIATQIYSQNKDIENDDKQKAKVARANFQNQAQNDERIKKINTEVKELCRKFLVPGIN